MAAIERPQDVDPFIIEHNATMTAMAMAEALGLDYCYVIYRRMRLERQGLISFTERAYNREWSAEEIFDLGEMLRQGLTDRQIAKRLGRTEVAVHLKWRRLGLKSRRASLQSSRRVGERMGVDAHAVVKWIEGGWLKARRGQRAGANRMWYITEEALYDFLADQEAQHAWRLEKITDPSLKAYAREVGRKDALLSIGEVARRFVVTHKTVNMWVHRGYIKGHDWGNWWFWGDEIKGFIPPCERFRGGYALQGRRKQ